MEVLFLNLIARRGWLVDTTLQQFTDREDLVSILQEAGFPQGQFGGVRKISSPPGFKARTLQLVARHCTDCTILVLEDTNFHLIMSIVQLRIRFSALIQP